jgi:putative endonuclease
MARDYSFWVYIVTNRNHSVLYIGVTNSLSRRTWQHREGTGAEFPSAYRCTKFTTSIMQMSALPSREKLSSRNGHARRRLS